MYSNIIMTDNVISYKTVMRMNKKDMASFIRRNRKYAKNKKKYKTTGKSKKELVLMARDLWGNY